MNNMRTRAQDPAPPVSPVRNRTTRNSLVTSPTANKPPSLTPRKVTRSFTSDSGMVNPSHGKVQGFRDGHLFVVTGIDSEVIQLYEFADQKRKSSRSQLASSRAERRARRGSLHEPPNTTSFVNGHSKRKRTFQDDDAESDHYAQQPPSKQSKRNAAAAEDDGDDDDAEAEEDAEGEAASDDSPQKQSNEDDDYPERIPLPPVKSAIPLVSKRGGIVRRRRRGGANSILPSREPTPPPQLLPPEEDVLSDNELPSPFTDEPFDDPNLPDDVAQELYLKLYQPMTQSSLFVDALVRHAPNRRTTENLYVLAANTAAALRAWQDEYLELEKITAPHAAIPRKAATGQRNPLDPAVHEDQKEADLYDYLYDAKKVGFQDPLAQRVVRDASGRELRTRQPRGQSGITTANVVPEDTAVGRRARKPVTRFDGAQNAATIGTRRRGIAASETPEVEAAPAPLPPKRGGRVAGRGRGGRGGRGGTRGGASGLLGKRIQEMRAESVVSTPAPASEADENDFSGSEAGQSSVPPFSYREESTAIASGAASPAEAASPAAGDFSPDVDDGEGDGGFSADGVALTASGKRKGRPKGSKNHHKRSDAGIPKGPRVPKSGSAAPNGPSGSPLAPGSSPDPNTKSPAAGATEASPAAGVTTSTDPKKKPPRSEKRSQSMVEWWAKRKAKAAEEKALLKNREQAEQAERARAHVVAMQSAHAQAGQFGMPPPHMQQPGYHPQHGHYGQPPPPFGLGVQHQGNQGGYISPFGPPPGAPGGPPPPPHGGPPPRHQQHQQQPPPQQGLPPPQQQQQQQEYRSPFPPTSTHPGYAHHLHPAPTASAPPPHSSAGGTTLPSIGQSIGHGHGPWDARFGAPPKHLQQQTYYLPQPTGNGPQQHDTRPVHRQPLQQGGGPPGPQEGQQQHQGPLQGHNQGQPQDGGKGGDNHGYMRSF